MRKSRTTSEKQKPPALDLPKSRIGWNSGTFGTRCGWYFVHQATSCSCSTGIRTCQLPRELACGLSGRRRCGHGTQDGSRAESPTAEGSTAWHYASNGFRPGCSYALPVQTVPGSGWFPPGESTSSRPDVWYSRVQPLPEQGISVSAWLGFTMEGNRFHVKHSAPVSLNRPKRNREYQPNRLGRNVQTDDDRSVPRHESPCIAFCCIVQLIRPRTEVCPSRS